MINNNKFEPETKQLHDDFRISTAKKDKLNIMQIPKIDYVVVSAGCGKFHKDSTKFDTVIKSLTDICAAKAVKTLARKSVSNFSIREGMPSGAMVTLRGVKKYDFLDQLINIVLPRIQDFQGLSYKSFATNSRVKNQVLHGRTNLNFGIKSHHVFPISSISEFSFGMNVCIGLSSTKCEMRYCLKLLKAIGLPFRDEGGKK